MYSLILCTHVCVPSCLVDVRVAIDLEVGFRGQWLEVVGGGWSLEVGGKVV